MGLQCVNSLPFTMKKWCTVYSSSMLKSQTTDRPMSCLTTGCYYLRTFIIIINPSTVRVIEAPQRVIGAPQMISQPVSSIFFFLFSTALWDLGNSRPVYSLMLSSHLFLCLPCFLPPLTVPCKMVLARLDESET